MFLQKIIPTYYILNFMKLIINVQTIILSGPAPWEFGTLTTYSLNVSINIKLIIHLKCIKGYSKIS